MRRALAARMAATTVAALALVAEAVLSTKTRKYTI